MKFKKAIFIFMVLCFSNRPYAQQTQFPSAWMGLWQGDLEIFSGMTKVNTIPMSLEIERLDTIGNFKYYITYGEGEDALRPYVLKTIDSKKGLYVLDEDNGIQIEMFMVEHRLISAFEVQKSFIQTTSYLQNEHLIYEIYAGSMNPVSITGDTIIGTDTIPPVSTYPINVLQRAVLSKR